MIQKKVSKPKLSRRPKKEPRKAQTDPRKIAKALAALNELKPPTPKAAALLALMKEWLADESGYDEEAWPELKKALDEWRDHVGARRLFDD